MKKTVEYLRADVVNSNGYYFPLKTLKEFEKEHKDDVIPVIDNIPNDGLRDDVDIEHLIGTITNFHIEGDSLYADVTIIDEFVEILKKFKKNGIELYLSPAIMGKIKYIEASIELAKSGGYYRGNYTFKNGKVRERTLYKQELDSYLSAKWLLFYKHLFLSKLIPHPELEEFHVEIINKTFYMVMTSIQLEKLTCDDIINKYVNLVLVSRIGEYMYRNASRYNIEPYEKGKPRKFILKNAINNQACSLDKLKEDINFDTPIDFNVEDIEAELKADLNDNAIGLVMLNYMLASKNKFNIKRVDEELNLSREVCTSSLKEDIANAYNIIKRKLLEYSENPNKKRMRKINVSSIRYSFES